MTNYFFKNFAANVSRKGIKKNDSSKILSLLTVPELKTLLRELKLEEDKNLLSVIFSENPSLKINKELKKKYPDANISVTIDKNIGAGIKIQKYDMIYDFTVKSRIKRVIETLEKDL